MTPAVATRGKKAGVVPVEKSQAIPLVAGKARQTNFISFSWLAISIHLSVNVDKRTQLKVQSAKLVLHVICLPPIINAR
jgi:hypothetical protein